jgi:hypothetical protein
MKCWLAILGVVIGTSWARAGEKYLIEFGWDEPTTGFMKGHVGEMEKMPFDGTVFHLEAANADGSVGNFMNEFWGRRAFTDQELKGAEENLRGTRFEKFRENFLRVNVVPGDLDWFDDFSAVVNNARQAGRIASAAGAAGILFDIEQYNGPLWRYAKQAHVKEHSWEEYERQVEGRGGEVMRAFEEGWKVGGSQRPLVVFQTYGYSLPYMQAEGDRGKLEGHGYGLLAPFMDGMYGAAGDGVMIVDGGEFAYAYKEAKEFQEAREMVLGKVAGFVKDREKYLKHTSFGLGLWMDYDWRKKGWDEKDGGKNYFTPGEFEKSLEMGLKSADEYVWVYTEKPKWWTAGGGATGMAQEYIEAVRRAKESVGK